MAVLKSGAGTDTATVDANKALRVALYDSAGDVLDIVANGVKAIPYDSSGREISIQGKSTYAAAFGPTTAAATPTDVVVIEGSASKTIRVVAFEVSVGLTAATLATMQLIKHSTANAAGTQTNPTVVPLDSNNAAGTGVVRVYTANPTPGTSIGALRQMRDFIPAIGTSLKTIDLLANYGASDLLDQLVTLRGVAQGLALNFGGATLAGLIVAGQIVWTEE